MNKRESVEVAMRPRPETGRKVKLTLAAAAALLLAFLAGFVPSFISARSAERDVRSIEAGLELARLRSRIGMMSLEANRSNYASASLISSLFFDSLNDRIAATPDPEIREQLRRLSLRRDEITANLAQADPAVSEKLANMYAEMFRLTDH